MYGITASTAGQLTDVTAYVIAATCLVVGILLVVWGRLLGRGLLCLAGAAAGLAVGSALARHFGWHPTTPRMVSVMVLGLTGLALARLIWALLAGSIAAVAAGIILLGRLPAQDVPAFDRSSETLAGWVNAALHLLTDGVSALWVWNPAVTAGVLGLAACLPLVAMLVFGRGGRILMTSVVGAAAVMAGPIIAASRLQAGVIAWIIQNWWLLPAVFGPLAAFGMVVQYRAEIRAQRADDAEDAGNDDEQLDQPEEQQGAPAAKARGRKSKARG